MPRYSNWSEAEDRQLQEMLTAGESLSNIAQKLDRSYDATRCRVKRLRPVTHEPVIPPQVKQEFQTASTDARVKQLEMQLAQLMTQRSSDRVPVETKAEPAATPEEAWRHAEEESEKRIKHAHERSRFTVNFDDFETGPIGICFVSDQHISPGNTVDHRRMREDAELIAATPGLYCALGGDGVDNHIAIRSAGLAARSQPSDQWQLFEWYLGIFAPKIIALISGNHDAWTDQIAGVDMVSEIAKRQRLCYCPAEAHIAASLGGVQYNITFRHQYRFNSSMNMGHAVKQLWRFGEEPFDIGCVCHHHEPHVESFFAHSKIRWVCRPGSYQITSSYSRQYGWNETRPTCPTFLIYPGERRIIGFHDVRDAIKTLKAERG